jgi:hypothetical protein
MAQSRKKSRAKTRSRDTDAPSKAATIPDPLGDAGHVVPSGRLTSRSRDHEGLLGSGEMPLRDGGIDEHPTHDHGVDAGLQPDDYEVQFEQAPTTGFEPRAVDVASNDNEPATDGEDAREDHEAGAGDVAVRRRGSPD